MNFFTSDLHLGHEDRVIWDKRPFRNAAHMFDVMRDRWNAKVADSDDVWIIGDFTYYGEESDDTIRRYAEALRGRKHLIYGNHDGRIKESPALQSLFEECVYEKYIETGERKIFMYHYPLVEWYRRPAGSYLIYGHIHASRDDGYGFMATHRTDSAFNAGVMINGYAPVTFEELKENNLKFHKESDKGE